MSDVRVKSDKTNEETAVLLLEAAQKKDLDPGVVKFFPGTGFVAPEEVVKAASGLSVQKDEDEASEPRESESTSKRTAKKTAASDKE